MSTHRTYTHPPDLDWDDEDQFLTVHQLAYRLQVSASTIRRWQTQGRIKAYRLTVARGGPVRYHWPSIVKDFGLQ